MAYTGDCQDLELLDVGVVFHSEGNVFLSNTAWTLIVHLDIESYRGHVMTLQKEITTLAEIYEHTRKLVKKKRQWVLELQAGVIDHRREDCNFLLEQWGYLENLLQLENPQRNKRTVFEGSDKVVNWLFGTPTRQEVKSMNEKLVALEDSQMELHTVVALQATLLNSSLVHQMEHKAVLKKFAKILAEHEERLSSLERQQDIDATIEELDHAFALVNSELISTIAWARDQHLRLVTIVEGLAARRLPQRLVNASQLKKILLIIMRSLPTNWNLVIRSDNLWTYYKTATVTSAVVGTGIRVFVPIHLKAIENSFTLYKVAAVPVAIQNSGVAQRIAMSPYLAVTQDDRHYTELDAVEVSRCLRVETRICALTTDIKLMSNTATCAPMLYSQRVFNLNYGCDIFLEKAHGATFQLLGDRWLYSVPSQLQLKVTCGNKIEVRMLQGVGILEIPQGCTGYYNEGLLQPTIKNQTVANISMQYKVTTFSNATLMNASTRQLLNQTMQNITLQKELESMLHDEAFSTTDIDNMLKVWENYKSNAARRKQVTNLQTVTDFTLPISKILIGLTVSGLIALIIVSAIVGKMMKDQSVLSFWGFLRQGRRGQGRQQVSPSVIYENVAE